MATHVKCADIQNKLLAALFAISAAALLCFVVENMNCPVTVKERQA